MNGTQVLVQMCGCESALFEQQTCSCGTSSVRWWGGMAGEQLAIKLFQFVCQIAQEKLVREVCLSLVAQELT